MNRVPTFIALVLILAVAAQCNKTPPVQLTLESAQRTMNAWAKDKSFTGEIIVESPKISQAAPDHATAGLKFKNFSYTFNGQPRTYSDTGIADFKQDRDGRWVLDEVQLFQISDSQYPAFKAGIEVR